jgi:hypothetical protein
MLLPPSRVPIKHQFHWGLLSIWNSLYHDAVPVRSLYETPCIKMQYLYALYMKLPVSWCSTCTLSIWNSLYHDAVPVRSLYETPCIKMQYLYALKHNVGCSKMSPNCIRSPTHQSSARLLLNKKKTWGTRFEVITGNAMGTNSGFEFWRHICW